MKSKIETNMKNSAKLYVSKSFRIFFYVLLGLCLAFLVGYVVMHLWNWLMPSIFGVPEIDYWKAVGVLLLSKIIFGFGGGNGPGKSKNMKKKKYARFNSCSSTKNEFSQWKYYDEFWRDEGEQAYRDYVVRNKEVGKTD